MPPLLTFQVATTSIPLAEIASAWDQKESGRRVVIIPGLL